MKTETYTEVCIPARKLAGFLVAIVIFLLSIHILLQVWHFEWRELPWLWRQFFDVDEEDSLPTWYSTIALLLTSGLLYLIGQHKQTEGERWARYWYGLALAFAFLSMDEIAGLHETLNSLVDFSWAIPVGIAVAILGLVYIRFLLHLPLRTRVLFIAAGGLYVGGAIGVETATDWYAEEELLNTLGYNLWTAVEEGMEMLGVVLFIHALLGYMGSGQGVRVDLTMEKQIG